MKMSAFLCCFDVILMLIYICRKILICKFWTIVVPNVHLERFKSDGNYFKKKIGKQVTIDSVQFKTRDNNSISPQRQSLSVQTFIYQRTHTHVQRNAQIVSYTHTKSVVSSHNISYYRIRV